MSNTNMKKIAPDVIIGKNVQLNDFINLYGCEIGDGTKIGPFVEIQKNASIGRNCKIQSHTFICEGHGVMFINDRYPKATSESGGLQTEADWQVVPTVIKSKASLGSNATILCGITIGEGAVVGAGSVVTKNVEPNTVVAGNPARKLKKLG
jgi:acetyltransferase-like isoleucine patch superfamily enzyme